MNCHIDPIIDSLQRLSAAAEEALESLETNDYRQEARHFKEEQLPLRMMPKSIKEIYNSVMRYCVPLIGETDNLPDNALLNSDNIKTFTDNLNATMDTQLAHQFSFIRIEPIQAVADEFLELGLHTQANKLENVCNFARAIRQGHNTSSFCHTSSELPPIHYLIQLSPEEFSEDEEEDNTLFTQFCSAFAKNSFTLPQKTALYSELKKLIADPIEKKPHLVVMAVIIYIRTRKSYKSPLPGSLNSCRETIFHSLGLDSKKCHSYGDDAFSKESSMSLRKYKDRAETILKSALGNTR